MKAKRKTKEEEDASRCFPKWKWMSCFRRKRANRNRPEVDDDEEKAGTSSCQESIIDMRSTTSTVRNWTTAVSSSSSDSSAGVDPAVTFEQTVTIDESVRRDEGQDNINPVAVPIFLEPPATSSTCSSSPSPTPSASVSSLDITDSTGSSYTSLLSNVSRTTFQYYISLTPSSGSSSPTSSPDRPIGIHICPSTWSTFLNDTPPDLTGSTDIRTTPVPPQSASREGSPTKPGSSVTAEPTPNTLSPVVFRGQPVDAYATWIGGQQVLVNVIPGHPTNEQLKCGRMCRTPTNNQNDQVNMAINRLNSGIQLQRVTREDWTEDATATSTTATTRPAVDANQVSSMTSVAITVTTPLGEEEQAKLDTPVKLTPVRNYEDMVGNVRTLINIIPNQRSSKELDIAPNYWTPVITPDPHMDTAYLRAARDVLGRRLLEGRLKGNRKAWRKFLRKKHTGNSKWLNTAYEGRLPDRPSIGSSLFQAANGETRVRRESLDSRRPSRVVDTRVEIRPTPPRVGILGRISRFFRGCFRQGDRQ